MSSHALTAPALDGLSIWSQRCSCGRVFAHADRNGVERLAARHLVAHGAAFLLTLAVTLPPGREPVEVTEGLLAAIEVGSDDDSTRDLTVTVQAL